MVMEAAPAAPLIVAEAQLPLELQIVPLDQPAQLGQMDQPLDRRAGGQVRQPELGRLRLILGPLDEQPFLRPGQVAPAVALRRTNPQGRTKREASGSAVPSAHVTTCQASRGRPPRPGRGPGPPVPRRRHGAGASAAISGHRRLRARRPDRGSAQNPEHVVQSKGGNAAAKAAVVAIGGVPQDCPWRHALGQRRLDLRQRDCRLGPERHLFRNPRLRAPFAIRRPGLRQVQPPRHWKARRRRRHRQRHRNLAVMRLPCYPQW